MLGVAAARVEVEGLDGSWGRPKDADLPATCHRAKSLCGLTGFKGADVQNWGAN